MRVLQVINAFGHTSGGAERLALDLHVDLLESGIDAHLVGLMDSDTSGLRNTTSLGFENPYKLGVFLALRAFIAGLKPKPDVIHVHLFPASAYVAGLKRIGMTGSSVVFTEHNTSNRRREKALLKPLDGIIYRTFGQIYCISNGTEAALLDAYPYLKDKTLVVENGATLRFNCLLERSSGPTLKILSMGRLVKQKNYAAALNALSMLKGLDIRYKILGDGDDRLILEEQAKSLEISDRVEFAGHKADVTSYLEEADIFLIPSLWEGFGLAAVEGMNAGLPVVASDVSGLREVVGTDSGCALLVQPSNPQSIAAALQELVDDRQKRQVMGKAAFERSKRFDKRQMTEKYISAYRTIVQEIAYA